VVSNIATRQLLTWRGTVKQRIKSVKRFQSVWQPKVLIILLGSIYKVDLNRAYQDVLAKLAHVNFEISILV